MKTKKIIDIQLYSLSNVLKYQITYEDYTTEIINSSQLTTEMVKLLKGLKDKKLKNDE